MSFVDLLFPQEELEALGNKWHEPAPKRRKLGPGDAEIVQGALGWREQLAAAQQRRHRLSTPAPSQYKRPLNVCNAKRANSETLPRLTSITNTQSSDKDTATTKSCLPSFIEPSILRNYLHHLHPKDRHRYTISNGTRRPSASQETAGQMSPPQSTQELVSSPGSLTADSSASPASTDNCPTPAAVCERFRSGPFGHIFDGMRLTDNERDLMEDLLSPTTGLFENETTGQKRKNADAQVAIATDNYYEIDEALLQKMFPPFGLNKAQGLNSEYTVPIKVEKDDDVHSSGLSPAAEETDEVEQEVPSHRGIAVYDYNVLNVDDFFDLDEAST